MKNFTITILKDGNIVEEIKQSAINIKGVQKLNKKQLNTYKNNGYEIEIKESETK